MRKLILFARSRLQAFGYAISGWAYVIRSQRNAWIHAVFSAAALLVSFWLELPLEKIALIVLTITMVWTAEFLNTALEAVVDLASPQNHPLAKVGKDVGAAAVLIAALASIMIGLLVLGPPLMEKLHLNGG